MIVVADTSVLNYLIRLRQVAVLPALYGRVTITYAVLDEMRAHGAPPEVREWAVKYDEWIDVASANEVGAVLPMRLGPGEQETIKVARKLDAKLVLMDDQAGRLAAEAIGLHVVGTIAVLLQASRVGLVDFQATLIELKRLGFRLSPKVEIEALRWAKVE